MEWLESVKVEEVYMAMDDDGDVAKKVRGLIQFTRTRANNALVFDSFIDSSDLPFLAATVSLTVNHLLVFCSKGYVYVFS